MYKNESGTSLDVEVAGQETDAVAVVLRPSVFETCGAAGGGQKVIMQDLTPGVLLTPGALRIRPQVSRVVEVTLSRR